MTDAERRTVLTTAITQSQEPWRITVASIDSDGKYSATVENQRSGKVANLGCPAPVRSPEQRQHLIDLFAGCLASR